MNLYYQVLGEVTKPGRYPIDKDEITVLDALSVAGDLNDLWKAQQCDRVRNQTAWECHTMDLCSMESLINSPAYYLQQGTRSTWSRMVSGHVIRRSTATTSDPLLLFWISLASLASSISLVIINSLSNNHGESRKQHRSPGGDYLTARPFDRCLSKWPWFVLSLAVALLLAG